MPLRILLMVLTLGAVLVGCSNQNDHGQKTLKAWRVGLLPDQSKEKLLERNQPLFDYISNKTGLPHRLIIPESYNELLELFGKKAIDLAWFGGTTYVMAHTRHGAIPLAMRDIDARFTSLFLTRHDLRHNKSLDDFKLGRFTFGSRLSTSGHLMPRHFMQHEQGINPEKHFRQVLYSGRHDTTVYQVQRGEVDLGAVNGLVYHQMLKDGRIRQQDVHIVWETPPYPDYLWAVRKQIPKANRQALLKALLSLSIANPEQAAILDKIGASGFLPVRMEEFDPLKAIMYQQGLLP